MKKIFVLLLALTMLISAVPTFAVDDLAYSIVRNNKQAVIYFLNGENGFIHIGGSVSWRNNNPGNLRSNRNQIATANNFAVFSSYTDGYNAMRWQLFDSSLYAGLNIREALEQYAPKSENDTERYIDFIEQYSGMHESTKLDTMSSSQKDSLQSAMIRFEGYIRGEVEYTNIAPY